MNLEVMKEGAVEREIQLFSLTVSSDIHTEIIRCQPGDVKLERIRKKIEEGKEMDFAIHEDGSIRYKNRLCVPQRCAEIKEKLMQEAHHTPYSVHPGGDKLYKDLKKCFWWPKMKVEVAEFVSRCLTCQKVKFEHKRMGGLVQPLDVPKWKWDSISMDFVVGLPLTRSGMNQIWVIVDRLTKSARFIPMRDTWSMDQMVDAYMKNVVRYHGVPSDITSDRDSRFLARFWQQFQKAMGTKLNLSPTFHPATDGQTERTIQTLEDMLRACVMDFQGSWVDRLHLIEFSYNNSYHASIKMAPYEALYGRKCRTPLCWSDISETVVLGPQLIEETMNQVRLIQDRMRAAQDRQKSYADLKRRPVEFEVGEKVFLKVSPTKGVMRFGRKGKLSPKFIGPYEILDRVGSVAYRLALPLELERVHNVFHVSQLKRYIPDPSHVLEPEVVELDPNLSYEEYPIKILDSKTRETRSNVTRLLKILWSNHGTEEATWEAEEEMKNKYPHLFDQVSI